MARSARRNGDNGGDVSLAKLKHLEADMKKCFRCSLCKMVPLPTVLDSRYSNGCPVNREFHFHGYSGSGKSITALSLIEGRIEVDPSLAEIAFACTACGLCDVSCKFIMEAEEMGTGTNSPNREISVCPYFRNAGACRVVACAGRTAYEPTWNSRHRLPLCESYTPWTGPATEVYAVRQVRT